MGAEEERWAPHLPLKPYVAAIMGELASGPLHGYALMTRLEGFKGGRGIGPATLYRTLDRLVTEGWIRPVQGAAPSARRGSTYALTSSGRGLLTAEVARLEGWARTAKAALGASVAE
ncbi:MAG: PadR family transcriptional regulator [Gemmatimonadota bacterium]|nr:PadR family transcriptional regulator [Gemmatimonadota bacterium]